MRPTLPRPVLLHSLALLIALAAAPALAEPMADSLTRQLSAQGYSQIVTRYTWLGRLHVAARRGNHLREIVVNPNTGEILRDYQQNLPTYANAGNGGGAKVGTTSSLADTRNTVDKSGSGKDVDVSSPVDTATDSRKSPY